MAQVPLQSFGTVEPNATPPNDYQNIQASPAAFGGLVGAAEQKTGANLEQASNDFTQMALVKQQRFNQISTDDAFNNFQTSADNLTYGNPSDPSAAPGLYTLRGADALRAGPLAVKSLTDTRDKIKAGLQNDAQRLLFDEQSRRILQYKSAEISRHLDQQADVYGLAVNKATIENSQRSAGLAYNSDDAIMHSLQDSRQGAVRSAQIQYGQDASPEIIKNAIGQSDNGIIRAAVYGASAQDPQRASAILDKFGSQLDPTVRAELTQHLKSVNSVAIAHGAVMDALGAPAGIADAIHGQESGGKATSATSVNGARGGWQITPATFQQYAKPGESIDNPADNDAVGHRIVDDLSSKYEGDPARVAVAYFSGPGNVAPPGSPTPWKQDHVDGNGTSTSQYVNGVLGRMGQSAGAQAQDPNLHLAGGVQQQNREPPDFTSKYNTALSPAEETQFQEWVKQRSAKEGRNVGNDLFDYDLRGAWKANAQEAGNGHLPDTFKKPNHPTFSDQSQYNGVDGNSGGKWVEQPGGGTSYQPSATNLQMYGAGGLQSYFKRTEPDTSLVLPQQQASPTAFSNGAATRQTLPDKDMAYARVMADPRLASNPLAQQQAIAQLNRLYAVQDKVAKERYEGTLNPLVTQMIKDATKIDPVKDIANNPNLTADQKQKVWEMYNTHLKQTGDDKDTKTYGPGFWDAYKAVNAPASDPGKITDPQVLVGMAGPGGGLTVAGVEKLQGVIAGRRSPDGEAEQAMKRQFFTNAKGQISGSDTGLHIRDPKGDELYLKFLAHAMPAYDAGRKAGLTPAQMLDPDSKDYIGKSVATFKRPMNVWVKDMVDGINGPPGGEAATPAAAAPAKPTAPEIDLTTRVGIVSAYRSGAITQEQAGRELQARGLWKPAAASPAPASIVPTDE